MSVQSTSNFIFNNLATQNGANTAYQFTVDYQAANGRPYQFRSQTERMQALIGRQGLQVTYEPNMYCRFYTLSNVPPSTYGPPYFNWGSEIGTPGGYQVAFTSYIPGSAQTSNVGLIAKGYVYSPVPTTVRFQTISKDGIILLFNRLVLLSNWSLRGETTDTTDSVFLARGYTPIELRCFQQANTFQCSLFTNIAEAGFTQNTGVLFNNAANRQPPPSNA